MMSLIYMLGALAIFVVGILMGMNLGWDMAHEQSPRLNHRRFLQKWKDKEELEE